jgi:N-acetylmuramoyl-L-alanine amidase
MPLPTNPIGTIEFLVVHCAASSPDMDIGVAEIRKWHLQRGFADIGYHYVIRRNGLIEKGRPDSMPGAHAEGYNMHSLGLCLVGGLKKGTTKAEDNFEAVQKATLFGLLKELHGKYPTATILGHRDLPGVTKACPSFDVSLWLKGTLLEDNTNAVRDKGGPRPA